LGSRTGGALEDDDGAAAADEEELDAGVEAADVEEVEPDADFEDELEQPVRERAAATTATAADVKEGRYLTMTPSVSGCGKGGRNKGRAVEQWNSETRGLQLFRSRTDHAGRVALCE
jgi:hypothetical protein